MKFYENRRHNHVLLGLLVAVLAASGVGVLWAVRLQPSTVAPNQAPTQIEKTTPAQTAPKAVLPSPVFVYWLQARGNKVYLVSVPLARDAHQSEEATLTQGLSYLFTHPQQQGFSSAIPEGTKLLGLQVKQDGIHINLSREFQRGGGSETMIDRVAQVLYTATSLHPDAKVYLSVEGQLLDEDHPFSGEGLILSAPLTREQFAKEFSMG